MVGICYPVNKGFWKSVMSMNNCAHGLQIEPIPIGRLSFPYVNLKMFEILRHFGYYKM